MTAPYLGNLEFHRENCRVRITELKDADRYQLRGCVPPLTRSDLTPLDDMAQDG